MSLNKSLLKFSEELFVKVSESEMQNNKAAGIAIQDLYDSFDDADGYGDDQEILLIKETKEKLNDIMREISPKERDGNRPFMKEFREFQEHLDCLLDDCVGEDGDLYSTSDYLTDDEGEDYDDDCYAMDDDLDEEEDEWG